MTGWQPIETAPRDGRHLLLYTPDDGGSVMGTEYDDQEGYIFTGCCAKDGFWYCLEYTAFAHEPTHWMPLPDPPEDPCA